MHIASGGCALLFRYLSWREAALLAGAALALNLLVLPRMGLVLYRPADHARRFFTGTVLYPFSVLLLVPIFRNRPDIAAAAR